VVGIISSIVIVSENYDLISKTNSEGNSIESSFLSDSEALSKSSIVFGILQECGLDDECVILQIKKISKTQSEDVVVFVSNQIPLVWEQSNQNCHQLAHHIGKFLFGYFKGNMSKAISHVGNVCGNSLYHGVVENYLPNKVLLEDIKVEDLDITSPCMDIGSYKESNLHQQCVHGLGHSIARVYEYNVLEAIKRCNEYQSTIEQDMCADGLFMENNNEIKKTGGGDFDEDDIYYPCNKVAEKYKFRCYFYQGYYIFIQNDYSYIQSFEDCEKIPDEKFIPSCIGAISQATTEQFFYNDHEKIVKMCDEVNPKYQLDCIQMSLNTLTLYFDQEIGDDFCNLFPKDISEECIKNWQFVIAHHNTI